MQMSPMPAPKAGHAAIARLAPALPLVAIAVAMIAPRGTIASFIAIALLPILVLFAVDGIRPAFDARPGPLQIVLLLIGAYLAVNALWAVDRVEAYGKVGFYWLLLVLVWLAAQGITRLDDRMLERISRGLLIGCAVGALFLLIEVVTGQWIKRTAFTLLPFARPPPKHIQVQNDAVTLIGSYVLNRSFAVLSLALWPVLLLIRGYLSANAARIATALLLAATAVGVFRSEHETSMLSLVFASVAFLGVWLLPRLFRPLIVVGWIAATMLVVPLAMASYSAGLHQAKWIPETGRNRIILWNVTSEKVREAPILGIGIGSTKDLDEQAAAGSKVLPGHSYPQRTGRHAHNIYLQTWYELGAVGAILLLGLGLVILRQLGRLPLAIQPYAFASFVAAALIGAFSWGMWQTWFMAGFGIWALLLLLAIEAARRDSRLTPR